MVYDEGPAAETFGRTIQRLRRDAKLTQRDVAAQVGIDFTYLSKLENDRGEVPGEETVRKLAGILNADEEELLALAGKVPAGLRDRAQTDLQFARFLRRLPDLPDKDLHDLYRRFNPKTPKQ